MECDEYCIRVLKARQTEGVLSDAPIWTDVTTYEPTGSDLAATVVAAGFPCQVGIRSISLSRYCILPFAARVWVELENSWDFSMVGAASWRNPFECLTGFHSRQNPKSVAFDVHQSGSCSPIVATEGGQWFWRSRISCSYDIPAASFLTSAVGSRKHVSFVCVRSRVWSDSCIAASASLHWQIYAKGMTFLRIHAPKRYCRTLFFFWINLSRSAKYLIKQSKDQQQLPINLKMLPVKSRLFFSNVSLDTDILHQNRWCQKTQRYQWLWDSFLGLFSPSSRNGFGFGIRFADCLATHFQCTCPRNTVSPRTRSTFKDHATTCTRDVVGHTAIALSVVRYLPWPWIAQ